MFFREILIKVTVIFSVTIGILFISLDTSGANESNTSEQPVIEMIEFKVKDNTSQQQILKTSDKVTQDLEKYDGFMKRTLTQNSEKSDQWVDIIEWKSLKDAHASMTKAIDSDDENIKEYLELMKNGERTYLSKSQYLNIQSQTN